MPGFNSMFEGGSGAAVVTGADVASVTVQNEAPSGSIDGINTSYTTANSFIAGTLQVFLNGDLQEAGAGNDYVEGVGGFTMALAPKAGDKLLVSYIKT